jgi:hypothetical protein
LPKSIIAQNEKCPTEEKINSKAAEFDFAKYHFMDLSD